FAEGGPVLWPVQLKATNDAAGDARLLSVIPLLPLPERAKVAFFVTRGIEQATVDGCVSTSTGAHPLSHDARGREASAIDALVDLGVIAEAADLVVLQPFVTQSIFHESVAI